MPQFLVAIQLPDTYDTAAEDDALRRDISALNAEMVAAGIRKFVGGLEPARAAKTIRRGPDGRLLTTDGPFAGLSAWAEKPGSYQITGGGIVEMAGAFFTPFANEMTISGNGVSFQASRHASRNTSKATRVAGTESRLMTRRPFSAARLALSGACSPYQTGGYGFCNGLSSIGTLSKLKNLPSTILIVSGMVAWATPWR